MKASFAKLLDEPLGMDSSKTFKKRKRILMYNAQKAKNKAYKNWKERQNDDKNI